MKRMSIMSLLGGISRNALLINNMAVAAGDDLQVATKSVGSKRPDKKTGKSMFFNKSASRSAPSHLKPFYDLGLMFSEMGYDNYKVLKVDESASYFIVFIELKLNMRTAVLKNQDELAKLSMSLGADHDSSVYSGKALYNGEPCFLLGFPKNTKGKLELSELIGSAPDYTKDFKIPFAVCQRVDKSIYWVDLVKAGHSSIVGASGAGKSVFLNSLITQAMRHEKAQLFLIDMKQSEKDWGAVSRELPHDNFGNTFDGAIRVLGNVLREANKRRSSGNSDPIIFVIEEADKMMNKILVDDDNPIDQQFPSKEQHKKIRQQMTLVASELRSLGVLCYWVGQGALDSEVGSNIKGQFKTVYGLTVTNSQKSKNATGRGGEYLHLLSGNGDMQVYIDGKRVRGNSPYCSQREAVKAVKNRYGMGGRC